MIGMSTEGLYVARRDDPHPEPEHFGLIVDEDTGRVYSPNELRDEAAYLMHLADEADAEAQS